MKKELDRRELKWLYETKKMSQNEIAEKHGMSQKRVGVLMHKFGIKARRGRQDQAGKNNPRWKGDEAKRSALVKRVSTIRGRPYRCERCSKEDYDARYFWYPTGDLTNVDEYIRLCASCIRKKKE